MRFSVVIPLYNKAPYVAKAIGSVLSQTFTDYELVIVDDGSKDNSAEIAQQTIIGREHCRLIRQENAGVSVARNHGVSASKGSNLCFLDNEKLSVFNLVAKSKLNALTKRNCCSLFNICKDIVEVCV